MYFILPLIRHHGHSEVVVQQYPLHLAYCRHYLTRQGRDSGIEAGGHRDDRTFRHHLSFYLPVVQLEYRQQCRRQTGNIQMYSIQKLIIEQ